MSVSPIPEGFEGVTAYLIVTDTAKALDFYANAFGAEEKFRMDAPGGKVAHAEFKLGAGTVMIADEFPEANYKSPKSYGGTPVSLMFYVEDVDKIFAQALEHGAKEVRAVQDQFYGDRSGTLEDPFGHVWTISTHKEDLSEEEMAKRAEEYMSQEGAS